MWRLLKACDDKGTEDDDDGKPEYEDDEGLLDIDFMSLVVPKILSIEKLFLKGRFLRANILMMIISS